MRGSEGFGCMTCATPPPATPSCLAKICPWLVGKLLGHRRHRTTAGYAHLADAHLVEAAEHVGSIIAQAMAGVESAEA